MGCADVASCEHKVVNVLGVECAERYAVRLSKTALLQMSFALRAHIEAAGQVVVYLPAAVSYGVGELTSCFNVVLRDYVIANVSAAFALSRQETDEIKLPVVSAVVALVFDVVPNAEGDLEQLVAGFFGVTQGIHHAAELYPIEVCVYLIETFVGFEVHFFVSVICVRPNGRYIFALVVGFVRLNHKTHSHSVLISHVETKLLAKGVLSLASNHIFGVGKLCEYTVARAINENVSLYGVPGVCGQLKTRDALYMIICALCVANRAVENQLNVGFSHHFTVKECIPKGKISVFVAMHIVKQYFFHDSGLLKIANTATRAGYPHSYFRG